MADVAEFYPDATLEERLELEDERERVQGARLLERDRELAEEKKRKLGKPLLSVLREYAAAEMITSGWIRSSKGRRATLPERLWWGLGVWRRNRRLLNG